jgi:pimeloyl-ACP methyl ester carboxylesterase
MFFLRHLEMCQQSIKEWLFLPLFLVLLGRFHVQDSRDLFRAWDNEKLGMSREMNDRIAGSRLAILPRSKHMTFVDQTEMFNRAVDEFVHTNRPVVP